MILAAPMALAALVTALTPVVIYLLLRRRKTEVPWGASYLLRLTLASRKKSSRWRQMVVLVVRCLILALGALLLAGVLWKNPAPSRTVPASPPGPVHRAVLVDNSLSMSVTDGAASRLDRLRDALSVLLETQRIGDALTLIPLCAPAADSAEGNGARFSGQTLLGPVGPVQRQEIFDGLILHESQVRLSPALASAFACFSATPDAAQELYLFSDFPREIAAQFEQLEWVKAAALEHHTRIALVNMAGAAEVDARNVAVHRVALGSDMVLLGIPVTVHVEAANQSDQPVNAEFEIQTLFGPPQRLQVAFKPNENKHFSVPVTFTKAGDDLVRVSTDASRLEINGSGCLSVAVRDKLIVQLIAGDSMTPPPATPGAPEAGGLPETEFLLRALRWNRPQTAAIVVHEATWQEATQAIDPAVDLVLVSVPRFAVPAAAPNLAQFVRRGGGLVFFVTEGMDLASYNNDFAGLLPPFDKPARAKTDAETFSLVRSEPAEDASPLFAEFTTSAGGDLGEVRVFNHMLLAANGASQFSAVFRLSEDDPLLVHRADGQGHIYVCTSSLGISWNSLGVRQCFIPFLLRLLNAAASGRVFPRNIALDQTLTMLWDGQLPVTLVDPAGRETRAETTEWQRRKLVTVAGCSVRGLYQLKDAAGHKEFFTVSGPARESDLRALTARQAERLEALLCARIYASWPDAVAALGPRDVLKALWPWLLAAMLGLYLFETWFVRRV